MRLLDFPLQPQRRLPILLLLLVGIVLPFLIITLVPYYHKEDMAAFSGWGACLQDFGRQVYLQCGPDRAVSPLNYPTIGLLLSGGVIANFAQMSRGVDAAAIAFFRYYIAAVAVLAFLLLAFLARAMHFASWAGVALLILVMPPLLVGGILWGQLDGISLVFCLVAFLGLSNAWWEAQAGRLWPMAGWLAAGASGLVLLLLLKPLNTFVLPFFAFFAFLVAMRGWQVLRARGAAAFVLVWVGALGLFRYLDTRFAVPPGFLGSTFWYSWSGGASPHGDVIAGNGFNLWVLLGRDIWSSSRVPFAQVSIAGRTLTLVPLQAGIVLYGLFLLLTFSLAIYGFWPQLRAKTADVKAAVEAPSTGSGALPAGWQVALLCLLFALTQIGFSVLLTGTHERYLFLGYPFLLIATLWLATRHMVIGWRGAAFCWAIAFLNGIFVYGAMHPLPGWLFPVWNNAFQTTLHLVLLVFVLDVWWRAVRVAHATISV